MWLYLNDAMYSVVASKGDLSDLNVRARLAEDIRRHFPDAEIKVNAGSDYKYRATIPKEVFAKMLVEQVFAIRYHNFKNSVKESDRKKWYLRTWMEATLAQKLAAFPGSGY